MSFFQKLLHVENKMDVYALICAICIFLCIPPAIVWHNPYVSFICIVVFAFIGLCKYRTLRKNNVTIFLAFLILYLYFNISQQYNLFRYGIFVLTCSVFLFNDQFINKIFESFTRVYSILMIPSIVVFILVLAGFDYLLPSTILDPIEVSKGHNYVHYPFLVMPDYLTNIDFFRFMAFYDEPGVVGTISGLLLFSRRLNFKDWITYPVLISGILSMSLTFYVMLVVYILVISDLKTKIWILSILTVIISLSYVYVEEYLNMYILERLDFSDGKMSGNNRTSASFDMFFHNFIRNDNHLFFGYGNNYAKTVNPGGASYKDIIVDNGIFFFLAYILSFVTLARTKLKNKNIAFLVYIIAFACVFYQRPFIHTFVYFILLVLPIYGIKYNYDK